MRHKLLALPVLFLAAVPLLSDSTEATDDDVYWCYGDDVTMEYDGEATDVEWTVVSSEGRLLGSEDERILNIDASGHDELKVTQKVTTDRGSSIKTVIIRPLHQNDLSVTVRFFDGGSFYDQRVIDSGTVCKNRTFVDIPDNPVRDGRRFGGWVFEDGTPFVVNEPIVRDTDIHAKWLRQCSVILMSEGEVYSNMSVYEGDNISLSAPVSENGKQFAGWSMDRNVFSEFDQEEPVSGDMVLYAIWSDGDDAGPHTDKLRLLLIVPLSIILAIHLCSRLHRNKVRMMPYSSKGRVGRL